MDQLLYQPQNSLIHQSYHALERQDPVNGDGFGIGWYVPEISPEPIRYVSVKPAWNDMNLRSMAPKTKAECFFAHVRDASVGAVTELNCHPFQFGPYLMMHNGRIEGFKNIKRPLRAFLAQNIYDWLSGETDTEHFFALFLHHLYKSKSENHQNADIIEALVKAIISLKQLFKAHQPEKHFYLNLAITDGKKLVACRYDTNPEIEAPTLYYSTGGHFQCVDGYCRMVPTNSAERSVLIVSERLTEVEEDWHKIPEQHLVVVSENLDVSVIPIEI